MCVAGTVRWGRVDLSGCRSCPSSLFRRPLYRDPSPPPPPLLPLCVLSGLSGSLSVTVTFSLSLLVLSLSVSPSLFRLVSAPVSWPTPSRLSSSLSVSLWVSGLSLCRPLSPLSLSLCHLLSPSLGLSRLSVSVSLPPLSLPSSRHLSDPSLDLTRPCLCASLSLYVVSLGFPRRSLCPSLSSPLTPVRPSDPSGRPGEREVGLSGRGNSAAEWCGSAVNSLWRS